MIDVDFFSDLVAVLRGICVKHHQRYLANDRDVTDASAASAGKIDKEKNLRESQASARTSLHCITAAFDLLSGQGEVLNLDMKDFTASLYSVLMRLPSRGVGDACEASVVDGVNDVFAELGHGFGEEAMEKRAIHVQNRSEIELVLGGLDALFCRKKQVRREAGLSRLFSKLIYFVFALHIFIYRSK